MTSLGWRAVILFAQSASLRGPWAMFLALLLTACATPRTPPVDPNAYWSGRLAIQVLKEPPEALSAGFELQGSASEGQLVLFSPIGTTLAQLTWKPGSAWLTQGEHRHEASNLQSLSTRLTGTELPIGALFEWLGGRNVDAPGWQVDLSGHAQGKITAQRRLPSPGAVLRIVLDR